METPKTPEKQTGPDTLAKTDKVELTESDLETVSGRTIEIKGESTEIKRPST